MIDDGIVACSMGAGVWIQLKVEERSMQLHANSNFVMMMCFSPSSWGCG